MHTIEPHDSAKQFVFSNLLYKYCFKKFYYRSPYVFLVQCIFPIFLRCAFHGMSTFGIPHAVQPGETE